MNFPLSRSTQFKIAGCVLLLFFLYVAWPGRFFFLNDDFIHIPLAGEGSLFNRSFIRPVSDITLYIDHLLWQKNAAGYHVTNILLHLLNTGCVFVLAGKLFSRFSPVNGFDVRPWIAAFIFLLNGCATESVFWIIGRGGSLAGLFSMLSLIAYFNKRTVLSLLLFIIGVFAYEAVLALPAIVTIIHCADKKTKSFSVVIAFWLAAGLYLVYRVMTNDALMNPYEQGALPGFNAGLLLYNFNALVARSFIPTVGSSIVFLIAYILVLLFIFIAKRKNALGTRVLFLCILVSVLPFITLGADTHDSESGRFVYLSVIFACMLLAELTGRFGWALVLIHGWFFFLFGNYYQYAGNIAKQTLECLHGVENNTSLIDVPQQYHGALIFRSGLPEALQWYNNEKSTVNIVSLKEIVHTGRLTCEKTGSNSVIFRVIP